MKTKMIQLLLLFSMVSLFSSSKENSIISKEAACTFKCTEKPEPALQGGEKRVITEEDVAEYPFALTPGSYLFRY